MCDKCKKNPLELKKLKHKVMQAESAYRTDSSSRNWTALINAENAVADYCEDHSSSDYNSYYEVMKENRVH